MQMCVNKYHTILLINSCAIFLSKTLVFLFSMNLSKIFPAFGRVSHKHMPSTFIYYYQDKKTKLQNKQNENGNKSKFGKEAMKEFIENMQQ